MSGQPVKTASEVNEKRNEYMETLALQSKINDMNLQANKNYLSTGILPAVSQIKDTRTTAEKLADVERIKQDIVGELKGVYDASSSMAICNKLMSSPLNIDNKLFIFFAQNLPSIVQELKKKYKYGVSGDVNDIETIVKYIEGFYSQTRDSLASAKSYFKSGSSADSKMNLMSKADFDTLKTSLKSIEKNLASLKTGVVRRIRPLLEGLIGKISYISANFPSNALIDESANMVTSNQGGLNNAIDLTLFTKMARQIPPLSNINTLIRLLERSVDNNNVGQIEQILTNLNSIFEPIIDFMEDNLDVFNPAKQSLNVKEGRAREQVKQELREVQSIKNSAMNAQKVEVVNQPLNVITTQSGIPPVGAPHIPAGWVDPGMRLTRAQIDTIANAILADGYYRFPDFMYQHFYSQAYESLNPENRKNMTDRQAQDAIELVLRTSDQPTGAVAGYGVKKRRGRPKGSGIIREKPKSVKVPNYVDFGTNEINGKKLEDNILTIRRKNRSNYMDMPSKLISPTLQKVIKAIVGGSVPSYNDIKKLDTEEQNYLHKVLSKSNLLDKFTVPAPCKDKREQDIHAFEVMKGEIMSGNDSKELVKKFKLHIVRLSREGVLPKNEVNELLTTLVELGY